MPDTSSVVPLLPDTSSVVSLIGLFQVNITFELLYIGLPELRFRTNLYNNIVEVIDYHRYSDIYQKISETNQDGDLSDQYHTIQGWICKLPSENTSSLNIDLVDYAPRTKGDWLLSLHDYFAKDRDKAVVWILTVFPALSAIWMRHIDPQILEDFFINPAWIAGMGILIPIVFVILGRVLASRVKSRLKKALEAITDKFGKEDLDEALDDLPF